MRSSGLTLFDYTMADAMQIKVTACSEYSGCGTPWLALEVKIIGRAYPPHGAQKQRALGIRPPAQQGRRSKLGWHIVVLKLWWKFPEAVGRGKECRDLSTCPRALALARSALKMTRVSNMLILSSDQFARTGVKLNLSGTDCNRDSWL
jgi:hypothetical protein